MKEEKFYILVVKLETDTLEDHDIHEDFIVDGIVRRSKAYPDYKTAKYKASKYIEAGLAKKYYIMECVAVVKEKPTEIIVEKMPKTLRKF